MVQINFSTQNATGSTNALANTVKEIYERLTAVFVCTEFNVCRPLENGAIRISKLMHDLGGDFEADIDIEFDDRNVIVTGYYDGCDASIDDVSMSTESEDVDSIYEKIEDAICIEYGKIAENEMRGMLLQYYKE